MNEIRELINYVEKEKIPLEFIFNKENKVFYLFKTIRSNPNYTLDEAIFDTFEYQPSFSSKYKLTNKLKELLYDKAFKYDYPNKKRTAHSTLNHLVYKNWATVNLLAYNNQPRLAKTLAKRTLKLALKNEMVDLSVLLTKYIITRSQLMEGIKGENYKYLEILMNQLRLQDDFNKINIWYGEVSYLYKSSKGGNTSILIEKLDEYCREIIEMQRKNNHFNFNIIGFNMISTLYILRKDYSNAIITAKKSLSFLKSKPIAEEKHKRTFQNDLIISYILTGEHTKAGLLINKNLTLTDKGTHNYFNILSYKFNNHVLSKDFDKLVPICIEALNHKTIKNNRFKNELWSIRMAYIHFLYNLGILNTESNKVIKFRIGKLVNEVPIFTKDKKGMHTSILIIDLLLLIQKNKYDEAIDREDRFKVYSSTYLKGSNNSRNKLFIKMLLVLVSKSNFHPERLQSLTEKHLIKLKASSYDFIQFDQEIIPYEILWEYVIILLRKNWNK